MGKNLWEELDRQNLMDECKKAEDWILDPSHTFGHVILYEKMVAVY